MTYRQRLLTFLTALLVVLSSPYLALADDSTPGPSTSPSPSQNQNGIAPSSVLESPSPSTALPTYNLPALVDSPFPKITHPAIGSEVVDRALPYADRCHTQQNQTASVSSCIYGNVNSKTAIVLFGDSHALAWFPAINVLAKAKGWKLFSYTMSSCWPADIPAWNSTTAVMMTNCTIWRKATLAKIAKIHPKLILVAGTRGFSTTDSSGNVIYGNPRIVTWVAGMERTLEQLKKASSQVFYLSDVPISTVDLDSCYKKHPRSIKACSTPAQRAISVTWLAEEEAVSQIENVIWVDPTTWICKSDPCSPLSGNILIYIDGGHLTATFSATLEKPLWAEISTFKI